MPMPNEARKALSLEPLQLPRPEPINPGIYDHEDDEVFRLAVAETVRELAVALYRRAAGDHDDRMAIVNETIVGEGLGDWEEEMEEARNQRHYDEKGEGEAD